MTVVVEEVRAEETAKAAAAIVVQAQFLANLMLALTIAELQHRCLRAGSIEVFVRVVPAQARGAGQRPIIINDEVADAREATDLAADAKLVAAIQRSRPIDVGRAIHVRQRAAEIGAWRRVAFVVGDDVVVAVAVELDMQAGAHRLGVCTIKPTAFRIRDVTFMLVVVHRDTCIHVGTDRCIEVAGKQVAVVIAHLRGETTRGSVVGDIGIERERAAFCRAAEQCSLRATHHFDVRHVVQRDDRAALAADVHAILEYRYARRRIGCGIVDSDAADRQARRIWALHLQLHARHVATKIVQGGDAVPMEEIAG